MKRRMVKELPRNFGASPVRRGEKMTKDVGFAA